MFFENRDVASVLRRMSMTCREAKAGSASCLIEVIVIYRSLVCVIIPRQLGVIWSSE